MNILYQMAEERIREAMQRGEFDDLPGAGKPLALEQDPMMPEELRMAYRVLKNANCLPPELVQRREIRRLEELLVRVDESESEEAGQARRRLRALRLQLELQRGRAVSVWTDPVYQQSLLEHMDRKE